jgi:hypothetical protein
MKAIIFITISSTGWLLQSYYAHKLLRKGTATFILKISLSIAKRCAVLKVATSFASACSIWTLLTIYDSPFNSFNGILMSHKSAVEIFLHSQNGDMARREALLAHLPECAGHSHRLSNLRLRGVHRWDIRRSWGTCIVWLCHSG